MITGRRDGQGVWDGHGHTAVFNTETQQGPAARHGDSAQCRAAAWLEGRWGEWLRLCVPEPLCCLPGPITALAISHEKKGK